MPGGSVAVALGVVLFVVISVQFSARDIGFLVRCWRLTGFSTNGEGHANHAQAQCSKTHDGVANRLAISASMTLLPYIFKTMVRSISSVLDVIVVHG